MTCESKKMKEYFNSNRRFRSSEDRPTSCSRKSRPVDRNGNNTTPFWSTEPSTSSAHGQKLTNLDDKGTALLKQIVTNDVIMQQVIQNVTNFKDRLGLEGTCKRLRRMSLKTPWKFSKLKNELRLTYYALDPMVTLEHGDLRFTKQSMTLVGRRETSGPRNLQRQELLIALEKVAERFGHNIRCLSIGGTDETARMYGIGEHQLIITSDFLKLLLQCFPFVERLCIKNCGFDREAAHYLYEYKEPIFPNLKHLSFISVWCDGDAPPYMLTRFIHKGLLSLFVKFVKIEHNIGDAIVGVLENEKIMLQHIDVTIANYFKIQPVDVQMYLRRLSRSTNKMTVRITGNFEERSPALIAAFQVSAELENINCLYVYHIPLGRYENFDFDDAIQNSRSLRRLTALTLNGWEDPGIIKGIIGVLTGAFLLESLSLRNIPETGNPTYIGLLDKLFSVLKVYHLELSNIRDMNSNHLRTLVKQIPYLKTLKLSRIFKVSTHAMEQCLRKWRDLEFISVETPISSDGIDILCNKSYLPHLMHASFWMLVEKQKKSSMEKLLMHFHQVDCWTNGTPERYCRVQIRDRRSSLLETVSTSEMKYCHVDHNHFVHEPLRYNCNSRWK